MLMDDLDFGAAGGPVYGSASEDVISFEDYKSEMTHKLALVRMGNSPAWFFISS